MINRISIIKLVLINKINHLNTMFKYYINLLIILFDILENFGNF